MTRNTCRVARKPRPVRVRASEAVYGITAATYVGSPQQFAHIAGNRTDETSVEFAAMSEIYRSRRDCSLLQGGACMKERFVSLALLAAVIGIAPAFAQVSENAAGIYNRDNVIADCM